MKIGIDIDGVLTDFCRGFALVAGKLLGREFPTEPYKTWEISEALGMTIQEEALVWGYVKGSYFWEDLPEDPSVTIDTFAQLEILTVIHEVYFITTRVGEFAKLQTERWLHERGITFPTVLITPNGKGDIARGLALNIYLDDYHENALEVAGHSPGTEVFLRRRPYNEEYRLRKSNGTGRWYPEGAEKIVEVEDIGEFLMKLEGGYIS